MKFLLPMAATAALICGAQAAHAGAPTDGLTPRLEVELAGRVTPHCVLGDLADMHFGDISQGGKVGESRFALDCNVPFQITLKSSNGGLANTEAPRGQGPYAGLLPYSVQLDVPVRAPQQRLVQASFTSRQMTGGSTLSSGDGIASDGGKLRVELGTPTGAGLLAGQYREVIELQLAPRT